MASRRLPFERVAAADQQTIFDMAFFMADVWPALSTAPGYLLRIKGWCLEVSAIAMIDLDDHIKGSQIRFHQGGHGVIAVFFYPLHSNYSFRPKLIAPSDHPEQEVVMFFAHRFFSRPGPCRV
jgi:hypothetical protein